MKALRPFLLLMLLAAPLTAGDRIRPAGLESLEWSRRILSPDERRLVEAIQAPLLAGQDVGAALQAWFDGRLLDSRGNYAEADQLWRDALSRLQDTPPLPPVAWRPWPDAEFTFLAELPLPSCPKTRVHVVSWQCGELREYGLVMVPARLPEGKRLRIILYTHGAAFGIPNSFLPWLARNCVEKGYVVIAPALRGEPLFQYPEPVNGKSLTCDGEIENLDGEVDDCLSMLSAAWKLPYCHPQEFAVIGHSFGAGVGLLAAARGGDRAKAVVSYDAWLVNPQRYYWDRMRRGPNNWLSWADFCCQTPEEQLRGLKQRSIILNAGLLRCPLLLFIGGAYEGSVFHQSHQDFTAALDRLGHPYRYEVIPEGGHNFILYDDEKPARTALKAQLAFLAKHYPPTVKERRP